MKSKIEIYKLSLLMLTSIVAVLVMVIYTSTKKETFRDSSAYQIPAYEINDFPVYDMAVQTTSQVQADQSFASWKVSRKNMQTVFEWYVDRLGSSGWVLEDVYHESPDVKWIEASKGDYKSEVLFEEEDGGDDFYINVRIIF